LLYDNEHDVRNVLETNGERCSQSDNRQVLVRELWVDQWQR
jgi:hypothetical protein